NNLQLALVSQTHSCDTGADDPTTLIADAGGLMIFGRQANPGPGAGVMIGGACVRARIEANEISIPSFSPGLGIPSVPPSSLMIPGTKGASCLPCSVARLGAPQVVSRIVARTCMRAPVARR